MSKLPRPACQAPNKKVSKHCNAPGPPPKSSQNISSFVQFFRSPHNSNSRSHVLPRHLWMLASTTPPSRPQGVHLELAADRCTGRSEEPLAAGGLLPQLRQASCVSLPFSRRYLVGLQRTLALGKTGIGSCVPFGSWWGWGQLHDCGLTTKWWCRSSPLKSLKATSEEVGSCPAFKARCATVSNPQMTKLSIKCQESRVSHVLKRPIC